MISSYLKLVHIFSINPYLGPLQVSLGKMIIDIFKWMVLYILVLFAFGCGLNQLLWYYIFRSEPQISNRGRLLLMSTNQQLISLQCKSESWVMAFG